jgi:hypothetical protein
MSDAGKSRWYQLERYGSLTRIGYYLIAVLFPFLFAFSLYALMLALQRPSILRGILTAYLFWSLILLFRAVLRGPPPKTAIR